MSTKTTNSTITSNEVEKFLLNTNYYLNFSRELVRNVNNNRAVLKKHEPAIRKAFDELAIVMALSPPVLEQASVQKILTEISDNINQKTVVTALHTLGITSIPKFSLEPSPLKPDSQWSKTQIIVVGAGFGVLLGALLATIIDSIDLIKIAQTSPRIGLAITCLRDTGIIATIAIGSIGVLKNGMKNFDKKANFKKRIWGAILLGAGASGVAYALYALKNLAFGLSRFYSLDPSQQYFASKHDLISSLGKSGKTCRAVVIDGLSSKWAQAQGREAYWDDAGAPYLATLSSHCNLRIYRDKKENPICTAIERGRAELGGNPLDLVVIDGHANESAIWLGPAPNTWYGPDLHILSPHVLSPEASDLDRERTREKWGIDWERARRRIVVDWRRAAECLKKNVQPKGQILLGGCNTATGVGSIAERLANATHRETTGFAAYMYPSQTSAYWANNKANFWSTSGHEKNYTTDSQGYPVRFGENTVRTFVPHHETCAVSS